MNSPVSPRLWLSAAFALVLAGCDKDLQQRVDRLEAELREIRSDTRDEVAGLRTRVISAEASVGVSTDGRSLSDRVNQLEGSLSEALSMKAGSTNEMVYLRSHLQGHSPISTDHGIFLVRMEGMDLNLDTEGYDIHLNIGNPQAVAIEQFTLVGHYGGGTPELEEGEEYSLDNPKIRAWQETLKPFEYRVSKTLEPFSWTPFDIEIPADSRDELEMLRFSMVIENARLKREEGATGSENSYAHLVVGSETASVLRTEYGAFLVSVKRSETTDLGTKLHLEIGNPYGFTLNQCRLVGEFGRALPRREQSGSQEEHTAAMREWTGSLQPFDAMITTSVSQLRWNEATVLIPAPEEQVQFLRCQLRIEDVTLPAVKDR